MSRIIPKLSAEETAEFVWHARSLITALDGKSVPWKHQGRTFRGMDCIGIIVYCFTQLGYEVQDRIDYGRLPAKRKLAETFNDHIGLPVKVGKIKMEDLQIGDLLTMTWGTEESHVAIVADHAEGGLSIIHSYKNSGRVIEQRIDDVILKKTYAVYRP